MARIFTLVSIGNISVEFCILGVEMSTIDGALLGAITLQLK